MTGMAPTWPRSFRYFVLAGLLVGLAALAWFARSLIPPLVISGLLAYVLHPAVDFLIERTRMPRRWAILVVYLAALAAIGGILAGLIPALLDEAGTLAVDFQRIALQLRAFLAKPVILFGFVLRPERLLPDLSQAPVDSTALAGTLFELVETVSRNVAWIIVILAAPYLLLQDWPRIREWLMRLAPDEYQPEALRLYEEVTEVWRGYLRGQLALMFLVAVIFSIAWTAIGLPGALILGILTGLFSIVPELGPAVAGVLAVLVALVEGSNFLPLSRFWFAVVVTGAYLVIINFKNLWLRPRLYGRSVRMHEGLVFVAILAALVLAGILGGLVVVPVLASAGVIGRYLRRRLFGLPPFPDWPATPETAAAGVGVGGAPVQWEPEAMNSARTVVQLPSQPDEAIRLSPQSNVVENRG